MATRPGGLAGLAGLVLALVAALAAEEAPQRRPTLILMLGGFRWDYLSLVGGETGGFKEFLKEGVTAEYVNTVFPSLSYPAWTTISTGVYPETHGILANFFYNRQRKSAFKMNDTASTKRAYWWQQPQPIWTAANKQGLRVATVLWSRSEVLVQGMRPEEAQGYEFIEDTLDNLRASLDRSLEYLQRGFDLVMAYSEHLDDVGHRYGPVSLEMKYSVGDVAKLLLGMFRQMEIRQLKDKVNVIVIGDHGMATLDPGDPIQLRQYLDPVQDVELALGQGAFVSIYAKPGRVEYIYNKLAPVPGLKVWRRGEVPRELHYNRNSWLPDIIVSAKKGIYTDFQDHEAGYLVRGLNVKEEMQPPQPHGIHGYTPDTEEMRTAFYAVGPDFKRGAKIGPIDLVDEYQVFCHVLKIRAERHNGTWSRVQGLFPDEPRSPYGGEEVEDEDEQEEADLLMLPEEATAVRDAAKPGLASAPRAPAPAETRHDEQPASSAPGAAPGLAAPGAASLVLLVLCALGSWRVLTT